MKYSYEYKRMCVELYQQGKWPETLEGICLSTDAKLTLSCMYRF